MLGFKRQNKDLVPILFTAVADFLLSECVRNAVWRYFFLLILELDFLIVVLF